MALLSEPDVIQFRRDYYELLMRLLAVELDQAMLARLREGMEERAIGATQVHRQLGEGWRAMAEQLERLDAEALAEEFTGIFLGPHGDLLNAYESYFLTGKLYSQPLANLRGFLARQGLERDGHNHGEPEDALAFELGVMARLIERQQGGGDADPTTFIETQREFLQQHLMIWAPDCAAELMAKPSAAFYRGVGQVLQGFLDVERDFFTEEGGLQVESIEAARRRYHSVGFRGPVFDSETLTTRAGGESSED